MKIQSEEHIKIDMLKSEAEKLLLLFEAAENSASLPQWARKSSEEWIKKLNSAGVK